MHAANQEAAANRRHAGQSDGSDNFSAAVQSTEILLHTTSSLNAARCC